MADRKLEGVRSPVLRRVFVLFLLLWAFYANALFGGQTGDKKSPSEVSVGEPMDLSLNLDPSFRFELEEALSRKDYEKAEQLLVSQIETNPDAPTFELLTYLGGLFFMDKKYLNAAIAYKKAEALEPLDNGNRFTLAMSYVLLGKRDWARPELLRLSQLVPGEPLYPYWLARLDYDDNAYQPAIEKLQALIKTHPAYVRAYDRLGLCNEALGNNQAAIKAYKQAIELNRNETPPSVWPPLNLGVLLIQVGEWQESETFLREAVAIDPDFAQAHYRLGLVLEKLERYQESAASLKRAAELDPHYPDPHWALGRVLRRTGDRAGAKEAVLTYQRLKKEEKDKTQPPPN